MVDEALIGWLKSNRVLHALDAQVIDTIVHIAQDRRFERNEVLFEEGDESDDMYLILDGQVVIQKRIEPERPDEPCTYKDLAICEAGDIIGEMALFDRKPRSATVRALAPLHVLCLHRADFERFLQHDSASASAILGGLLSMQNARLREAAQHNITLYELVNIVATVEDLHSLARQVVERLMLTLRQVDAGVFCLWNPYSDECEVIHARGVAADDLEILALDRQGPMANRMREGNEPFVLDDVGPDHPLHRVFRLADGDALLMTPLLHGRNLLGYLLLAGRGIPFPSFHRVLVGAVAAPLGSAIRNVRYAQDEAARKRLEAARASASMDRSRPR